MKLVTSGDVFILYLNKMYIQSLDFNNKEVAEKYIKNVFLKLSHKYNFEVSGYYIAKIYVDTNYGIIIEVKKEELEYLDYFSNQIEMDTKVIEGPFLYEITNLYYSLLDKFSLYKLQDKLYLLAKEDINDIEMGQLLEISKVIYGKRAREVLLKAKKVR